MRVVCLVTGFVFGSIPTGYIVSRLMGQDIRKMGSGNIGTTNALRTLGKGAGAVTLIGDIVKVLVPLFITACIYGGEPDTRYLVTMYTGLGAIIGHDFSPWLGFKGGKGIATSGGMILFTSPVFFVCMFMTIILSVLLTGYVSVGSIISSVIYIGVHIYVVATGNFLGLKFYEQTFAAEHSAEVMVLALIMAGIAIGKHHANIARLLNGTENKVFRK